MSRIAEIVVKLRERLDNGVLEVSYSEAGQTVIKAGIFVEKGELGLLLETVTLPDRTHTLLRISELMIRYRPVLMGSRWFIIDGEKGGTLPGSYADEPSVKVAARHAAASEIVALFEGEKT